VLSIRAPAKTSLSPDDGTAGRFPRTARRSFPQFTSRPESLASGRIPPSAIAEASGANAQAKA
jgi:hypothetical protein